jgi:hypothetical protein
MMKANVKPTLKQVCKVLERHSGAELPEERLWLAVVLQGIRDLGKASEKSKAAQWISGQRFEAACSFAGLDHTYARETIAMHTA